MRNTRPSFTAAYVATCRGLGRALPPDAQLVDDPWAARFSWLGVSTAVALMRSGGGDPIRGALATRLPFVLYMQVRTRALDEAVERFARDGGRQVVLLGAGFDARVARFPELQFFEVDHPATQARKRALLGGRATYVGWNFERDPMPDLPDALAAHGHDRSKPTLTIWEGVTMYLTEPAIVASVAAVHAYSAPGSVLAMTYFDRSRVERPRTLMRRLSRAVVAVVGEPFRFGFSPPALPKWLADRGFHLDADRDIGELARELLPARFAKRVADGTSRIAVATVHA